MPQTVLKRIGYNEYVVLAPGVIDGGLLAAVEADGTRNMVGELPDGSKVIVRLSVRPAPAPPFKAPGIPGSPPECIGEPYYRKTIHPLVRAAVKERDGHKCLRCGWQPNPDEWPVGRLELDHIVPVASGGCSHEHNLQTLCRACNRGKNSKHPGGPQPGTPDGVIGRGPCPICQRVGIRCKSYYQGQCTWCEAPWDGDHFYCCLVRWAYRNGHEAGWQDSIYSNRPRRRNPHVDPVGREGAGPERMRVR